MASGSRERRDRAAAARENAQASERRRERTVRIIGAVTVLAVVVGIVAVAVIASNREKSANAITLIDPDPNAPSPEGTLSADSEWAYGVPYGSGDEDAPVLAIWEDFQCPACGALEEVNGSGIATLAENGDVRLIWRPTAFLDLNLGNDASNRAIAAWGCAIDAGYTREYHDIVFAEQPEEEGMGWVDEEFIALGEEVGMSETELEDFTTCVREELYRPWAANSTQEFYDSGANGTPAATLGGVDIPNATLADEQALIDAVTAVAAN